MGEEYGYDLAIAALENKLAAKDAEIVELRGLAADVLGAVAAAGLSTPLEGYTKLPGRAKEDIAAIVRERDEARRENGNLSLRMAQCVLHRDEARELARKLLPLAEDCIDDLRVESRRAMTDSRRKRIERALADADKTIATAPEWLRHEP